MLGSRNSSHLQSPMQLLVSLNLNGLSHLKINKAVEVKEISNDKGNQRFIKISIPRDVVKSAVGNAPKTIGKPLDESDSESEESREVIDVERKAAKRREPSPIEKKSFPKAQKTPTKAAKSQAQKVTMLSQAEAKKDKKK
jgi:hypothetical protein